MATENRIHKPTKRKEMKNGNQDEKLFETHFAEYEAMLDEISRREDELREIRLMASFKAKEIKQRLIGQRMTEYIKLDITKLRKDYGK